MTYDWTLLQTLIFIITPYFLMLALASKDEDDDEEEDEDDAYEDIETPRSAV